MLIQTIVQGFSESGVEPIRLFLALDDIDVEKCIHDWRAEAKFGALKGQPGFVPGAKRLGTTPRQSSFYAALRTKTGVDDGI